MVIGIIYYNLRDSPRNNLRWARKHHMKAQKLYEEGDSENAETHYEKADRLRKKAETQLKSGDL